MKPAQVFDESLESVVINTRFRDWYLSTLPEGRSSVNLTRYPSGEYMVPEVQAMYKAFLKIEDERNGVIKRIGSIGSVDNWLKLSDETWAKLHELNGDAWLDEGHREVVVETMLNYALPEYQRRANESIF